jgi:hypothetical protein
MSLHNEISEYVFEISRDIQFIISKGWIFGEINYGERRLNIGPSMTLTKGEEKKVVYSADEIEEFARKLGEAE